MTNPITLGMFSEHGVRASKQISILLSFPLCLICGLDICPRRGREARLTFSNTSGYDNQVLPTPARAAAEADAAGVAPGAAWGAAWGAAGHDRARCPRTRWPTRRPASAPWTSSSRTRRRCASPSSAPSVPCTSAPATRTPASPSTTPSPALSRTLRPT